MINQHFPKKRTMERKFKDLEKWQQESLVRITAAEQKGESKVKVAATIAEEFKDEIKAKDKKRAVKNFYESAKGKIAIPANTDKVDAWKYEVVRQLNVMPSKNKRTDWQSITDEVVKQYPDVFEGVDAKKKIFNWVSRNKTLVEAIKEELASSKMAASTSHSSGPVLTTAHVYDDDQEMPTEEEVMPMAKVVKMDYDAKTAAVSAELDLLIGRGDDKKLSDEKYILSVLGYDPEYFELASVSVREGTWGCQKKGGEEGLLSSRRVMANIKPRRDTLLCEAFAEEFNRMVESHRPRPVKLVKKEGKNIAIVSIADLHLGKLAWAPETGENYDHSIAKDRFYYIIDKAITRMKAMEAVSPEEQIEEIIFFWSQDFFHFDSAQRF